MNKVGVDLYLAKDLSFAEILMCVELLGDHLHWDNIEKRWEIQFGEPSSEYQAVLNKIREKPFGAEE